MEQWREIMIELVWWPLKAIKLYICTYLCKMYHAIRALANKDAVFCYVDVFWQIWTTFVAGKPLFDLSIFLSHKTL